MLVYTSFHDRLAPAQQSFAIGFSCRTLRPRLTRIGKPAIAMSFGAQMTPQPKLLVTHSGWSICGDLQLYHIGSAKHQGKALLRPLPHALIPQVKLKAILRLDALQAVRQLRRWSLGNPQTVRISMIEGTYKQTHEKSPMAHVCLPTISNLKALRQDSPNNTHKHTSIYSQNAQVSSLSHLLLGFCCECADAVVRFGTYTPVISWIASL